MDFMKDKNIACFVDELASSAPVPGGGGAAALVAALAAALGQMVGSLTVGKKKYAAVEEEVLSLNQELAERRDKLLQLIDEDARVFAPLSQAYGLPRSTETEKAERDRVMEGALREACSVPLRLLQEQGRVVASLERMGEIGTAVAISDVGVAAAFVRAGLEAAALNIYINTRLMKDRDEAERMEQICDQELTAYLPRADKLYLAIRERLRRRQA